MNNEVAKLEYLNIQILKTEVYNIEKKPLQRGDAFQLSHRSKAVILYNLDKQLVRVIIEADISVIQDGKEIGSGAKFEIDNYFKSEKIKDFAHMDNENLLVTTDFAETVKSLAYSTARGIIYSKLAGTFLEGTILPITISTDIKTNIK